MIKIDSAYFRSTEVESLISDATKAYNKLTWKPNYTLDMIIEEMIAGDLKEAKKKFVQKV